MKQPGTLGSLDRWRILFCLTFCLHLLFISLWPKTLLWGRLGREGKLPRKHLPESLLNKTGKRPMKSNKPRLQYFQLTYEPDKVQPAFFFLTLAWNNDVSHNSLRVSNYETKAAAQFGVWLGKRRERNPRTSNRESFIPRKKSRYRKVLLCRKTSYSYEHSAVGCIKETSIGKRRRAEVSNPDPRTLVFWSTPSICSLPTLHHIIR